ncbi:MAG TPA: DnaJ domain-containing protein [Vicinamibacteria bacterium]|nr:DnaJ domain-containing protein [Vicinamibacteria bacterium]
MSDHYQLLGVPASASAAEIRQAYLRLARERHPDRFTDPGEKQRAQLALQEITTAFNTLVNPRRRQEYDEGRHRPQPRTPEEVARDAFERGQALLEQGSLDDALTLLRTAVHHAPGEAAYHAALGRALLRVGSAAREAVQALERATQLAPRNVQAFADLAVVLARQGMRLRAQKALETALHLAPRDPKLARLAAELGLGGP